MWLRILRTMNDVSTVAAWGLHIMLHQIFAFARVLFALSAILVALPSEAAATVWLSFNTAQSPVGDVQPVRISGSITTSFSLTDGNAVVQVRDANGNTVFEKDVSNLNFQPNTALPISFTYTPVVSGTFSISAGLFSSDWKTTYQWTDQLSFFAVSASTAARTYYVSPTGSNGNPGTLSAPLQTIGYAVSLAQPGTDIIVRAGTYYEAVGIGASGMAGAPIRLYAYGGEKVIVDGSANSANANNIGTSGAYVVINGFEVQNSKNAGIAVYNTHHVTISNNIVHGSYSAGIASTNWINIGNSHDNVIQGNVVYNNVLQNSARTASGGWSQGISVSWDNNSIITENTSYNNYGEGIGTFLSVGVMISNNVVYDNYSVEIYLDNAANATVNANSIYNTGNSGFFRNGYQASSIQLARETYSQSEPLANLTITNNVAVNGASGFYYGNYGSGGGIQNSLIANNTFVNATNIAIYIDPSPGHSGNTYANNIVYENVTGRTLVAGTNSGATFSHNNWFGGSAGYFAGAGDVNADPQFVTSGMVAATDYVLQPITSPCRGAGIPLSQVTTDYFGQTRSAPPTIGAFN